MKKITYLLIAAMSLVSVASCVKEMTPEVLYADGVEQEFSVTLPAATRTTLAEGKTVWAEGDSLWVYNGVSSESVVVPEEAWGQKTFKFIVKTATFSDTTKTIYVVYPYTAAAGVADGKVKVRVPAVQDGSFAAANIAAAVSEDYTVTLKNVTSILKVNIPKGDTPVYQLSISAANGNALTGTCAVDFSGATPVLTPATSGSNVSVQIDGFSGDFYVSVVPGTYDAGFRVTAATVDFEHASEVKETTVANTVNVNEIVDLGTIGTNLQPLSGDGTEANPWLIENLGHMIAFATAVNNGESFEGQFLKVANDISGINTPVGFFPNADNNFPFQGDFDGGNHTLTIDINSADQPYAIRLGLFGALNAGAHIHDLVIDGKVTSTGDAIAGLVGRVDVPANAADSVYIENVTNKAAVSGKNFVSGLLGYISNLKNGYVVIKNCSNEGTVKGTGYDVGGIVSASSKNSSWKLLNCTNSGAVSGTYNIGGLVGFAYSTTIKGCENRGTITASAPSGGIYNVFTVNGKATFTGSTGWDQGCAGICGSGQNVAVSDCINSGTIKGVTKVAGILGVAYWSTIAKSSNSGTVTGTGTYKYNDNMDKMSIVGGIVGLARRNTTKECVNTGAIKGNGAVGGIGGYVGGENPTSSNQNDNSITHITDCINHGSVTGASHGVGGVCGIMYASSWYGSCFVEGCFNDGKVVDTQRAAGGIVGMAFDLNNTQRMTIMDCINEGDVEAQVWAGGILGQTRARTNTTTSNGKIVNYVTIKNCENKGAVTGTRSDDYGEVVGGIIGAATLSNGNNSTMYIYNCLNSGPVSYKVATHVKPHCGGIVGKFQIGTVANVVNHGYVGPVNGEENKAEGADASLGAIAGLYEGGALNHAYFLEGVCSQAVGTAGTQVDPTANNVVFYDADGVLETALEVKGEFVFTVDDALNYWIGESTSYKKWQKGVIPPTFVTE